MVKHTCPVHGEVLVFKRMSGGGWGEVCPTFHDTGCCVFWDRRYERFYNEPAVVARASKHRGRCTSRAEAILAKLKACLGGREGS